MALADVPTPPDMLLRDRWVAGALPGHPPAVLPSAGLVVNANYGVVLQNSWCGQPLRVGGRSYHRGLFCHAPSSITVKLPAPGRSFRAAAGVQSNFMTSGGRGSVVFVVSANGDELFRSDTVREGARPLPVLVGLEGATEFTIAVEDSGDGIACDQAAWADARVTLADGALIWLGDLAIVGGEQMGGPQPVGLPFSFRYGGKKSTELLPDWPLEMEVRQADAARVQWTYRWADPASGLRVRMVAVEYLDYPTVEWTVYLSNAGSSRTEILEEVRALDIGLVRRETGHAELGEFTLHWMRGDDLRPDNYEPLREMIRPNTAFKLAAVGGRPTQWVTPYWNIEWLSEGVIAVLGWPGQWAAEFIRDGATGLQVRAGQELLRLSLEPGEEIRTPLAVLQFWCGDFIHAQNVWRAWMRDHNLPRPGGTRLAPQWNANMRGETLERADADSQIMYIEGFAERGLRIDYWWMDAGWYEGAAQHGWPYTGTWEVDRTRFPDGIRAVSDVAHAHGMKTIVWFEPERVVPGTELYEEHPEWLLGPDGGQKLLNLGNPDARAWITDRVHRIITEEGIDLYRQDHNIDPLPYWRGHDTPDRQGATENHYVSGYLAFWDELLRRNPDLLIDSCASGGRRNDLETMRRSVPKHRSDLIFEPQSQQGMTYGLSFWLPYHGSGILSHDTYEFWSCAAPSYTTAWDVMRDDLPYERLRELGDQFLRVAPYVLEGDYFPITPYSTEGTVWVGWQFHRADHDAGVLQLFRRADSVYEVATPPMRGLDPDATYELERLDAEGVWRATGEKLMHDGVRIAIAERPGVATVLYRAVAE